MKKVILIFVIMAGITSCQKHFDSIKVEVDNPNWRITSKNWPERNDVTEEVSVTSQYMGTENLLIGMWDVDNIGATLDTIGYAEFTIKAWDGLSISDIRSIGFSSAANLLLTPAGSMATWGGGISNPKEVDTVPGLPHNRNTFIVPLLPIKPGDVSFSARCVITFNTHIVGNQNVPNVNSGKIQIGIRMFNPRTGKFTTVKPVWGKVCKLIP